MSERTWLATASFSSWSRGEIPAGRKTIARTAVAVAPIASHFQSHCKLVSPAGGPAVVPTGFAIGSFARELPDFFSQRIRCAIGQSAVLQCHAQRTQILDFRGARGAGFEVLVHLGTADEVEFAIGVSVEPVDGLQRSSCVSFLAQMFCNCRRARASRDMTVPTGTSATSAISL